MASVTVLKNAYFSINSSEWSAQVKQITLVESAESLDKTSMTNNTRNRTGGLKDWSVDAQMFQLSSTLDSTLHTALGSTVAIEIRATTAAQSATNPSWTGTALFEGYQPVQGTVGELQMLSAKFSAAGDLTRT